MAMKRLPILLSLLLGMILTACGGGESIEAPKKNFLDSLYQPSTYRTMLDSIRHYENLNAAELEDFKAFMRENGDFISSEWSYRDINSNAKSFARTMKAPIGMQMEGMTPRTDKKIVEFRLDLNFTNQTDLEVHRFHAQVVWLDEEGKELDRSPRFAVNKTIAPGKSTGMLRLQYAYYRPTGNEMNQPKNEAQRRKVDAMLNMAKSPDSSRFKLDVSDILLENGMTAREFYRLPPKELATKQAAKDWPSPQPLLNWASKNKELVQKLQNPVGPDYLMVTPILTDKYEATHGTYLLFDRIDKFTGFFTGQLHIPSEKIISSPTGKMVLNEVLDFWKWPMELRIYKQ
jgi:hypothetical protein